MIVVLLRKFSHFLMSCLSLGSVTWLHRHLSSISSFWIHLWWGCFWLSGRFHSLLKGFWLTWGIRPFRSSDEAFVVDSIIFRHLVQSVLIAREIISWDSNWKKHRFYVGWKRYLVFWEAKKIPLRLCSMYGPDKILSLSWTPWYFAAALHTLLFQVYADLWQMTMMWKIPLQFVGDFIQISVINFSSISSIDILVNGFLVAVI